MTNTKLFYESQKELNDTQKVVRINGWTETTKGKRFGLNDNRERKQILAYTHAPN